MKIENPDSGQQLTIDPTSDFPSDGRLDLPRTLDRVPDGVLRMDDCPEGVSPDKWKSFLSATFEAVQAQQALQAPWAAFGVKRGAAWGARRQIEDAIDQAKENVVWNRVAELLAGTGLSVEQQHVAQAGSTRLHRVLRGGQEVDTIAVPWKATAEDIAQLARRAAGL